LGDILAISTVSEERIKEHPIRELLLHGGHPFPPDMEDMIQRLHLKAGAITADATAIRAPFWSQNSR